MKTKYEQIVDVNRIATMQLANNDGTDEMTLQKVIGRANDEHVQPAIKDAKKNLLLVIDMQNDFMEGGIGSLGVAGSKGDVERLTRFIYNNMVHISRIALTKDTHYPFQIFHPCWWKDASGNNPTPFTTITADDVRNGKWSPVFGAPTKSINYVEALEKAGKKQLMIWPYHCINGHVGASFESQFMNMVEFHAVARKTKPIIIQKGFDEYSEMYGAIKAEYDEAGFVNAPVLKLIEDNDRIFIAGEASSHCLLETTLQILENFANQSDITRKITILRDCTSAVTGCEQMAEDAFAMFAAKYGVQIMNSTDVVF